jgi:hypothetical protein
MKKVLILAAVAIGGYLLYRKFKPVVTATQVRQTDTAISAYGG